MRNVRPRETRLFIDDVRAALRANPFVLRVKDRRVTRNGEEMDLDVYEIKDFDLEFAKNYFYINDTGRANGLRLLMVPLALNGDE